MNFYLLGEDGSSGIEAIAFLPPGSLNLNIVSILHDYFVNLYNEMTIFENFIDVQ